MVLTGLITFVAASSALRDRDATVEVLVATTDGPRGALVGRESFATIPIAAASPLVGELVAPAEFIPGQLVRSLAAGQPLLRADVVPVESGSGSRTFTIPVEQRVLDGLALVVGDRIDVAGVDAEGSPVFVVHGVRVSRLPAAVGGSGIGASLSSSFVTVEVSDQQILALVAALRIDAVDIVRSTGAQPISQPAFTAQPESLQGPSEGAQS